MSAELEIPAINTSRSVAVDGSKLILANRDGQLFAYANNCPHARNTLDPVGSSVTSADGKPLRCQRHGAGFPVDTGDGVSGRCHSETLVTVALVAVALVAVSETLYLD